MEFDKLTIKEYANKIKNKEFSAEEGVKFFVQRIKEDKHNAVLEVFKDAIDQAKAVDKKVLKGEKLGRLAGVPIIIKDNILFYGHIASAGSKMLEKFNAPYSSTIVNKMLAEDAIIIGRANMDEFGMGSTGENSEYGATHNAYKMGCVAGGSSSGSAVAVAAGLCVAAIGTDTGASVRAPASYNGLFAIKPTYGSTSRYGIVAYASGLEQAGAVCKTAEDTELLQSIISGEDEFDGTLKCCEVIKKQFDIKKLKIGYVKEIWKNKEVIQDFDKFQKLFDWFKSQGAEIKEISIPHLDLCLPAYYIIAMAEATSNLSRYDGVKYTSAVEGSKNLDELYKKTRSKFFGEEVRRRITLGNFVLSSGYFDQYYGKAKKIQSALKQEFIDSLTEVDCLLLPITLSDALNIGEKTTDPLEMYMEDLFTVPANVTGVPALAIPFEKGRKGLPIGFQMLGAHFNDSLLFEVAKYFEKNNGGVKC